MNKEIISDNFKTMPCDIRAHMMSQPREKESPPSKYLSITTFQHTHTTHLSVCLSFSNYYTIYISITNPPPLSHTTRVRHIHPHNIIKKSYHTTTSSPIQTKPPKKCANKPCSQSTAPAAAANSRGGSAGPSSGAAASSSGSAATVPSSRAGSTSSRISAMAAW
jgi:hypothetical protein